MVDSIFCPSCNNEPSSSENSNSFIIYNFKCCNISAWISTHTRIVFTIKMVMGKTLAESFHKDMNKELKALRLYNFHESLDKEKHVIGFNYNHELYCFNMNDCYSFKEMYTIVVDFINNQHIF